MSFFRKKRAGEPAGAEQQGSGIPPEGVATTATPERPARRAVPVAGGAPGKRALPVAGAGGRPRAVPVANGAGAHAEAAPAPAAPGTPFEEAVKRALATVRDPEIGRPMVELGMIKALSFDDRVVKVAVELTTPACPLRGRIEQDVRAAIMAVPEVERVDVTLTARVRPSGGASGKPGLPGVKNTIAVASGKGGVGKSTVAANLAVALALDGAKVGLLDADVYGPSMPLMLDLQGRQPRAISVPPTEPGGRASQRLLPLDSYGVKVMSIGFLVDPEKPVIWRGPMASQLINQFVNDVEWGELDYLLIDLPPGTGDIQLTLTQRLPLSGAIIVTTPQDVALADAVKGLQMFREVQVPILGIIENMSYFICPGCGQKTAIFGEGGGEWASQRHGVPLLGRIPLDPAIREGGDAGTPIVAANAASPQAEAFRAAAQAAAGRLSMEAVLTKGQRPDGPLIQIQRKKPV
ncbi:MAG TPA: Mrp/NBP35 family ATP-binding protein [Thermomicrobiales bacterium]|nr:Mrp/NBP35 family ATP-binding protein [Thermomicrobiales bacterium]